MSQAVGPHADDRDVFVVQIDGEKLWTVYDERPVPFPGPDEQVGKTREFPPNFFSSKKRKFRLQENDVLYIPRGVVHEAETSGKDASLHVTIALATHDWTWDSFFPDCGSRQAVDFALLRPLRRTKAARRRAFKTFTTMSSRRRPSLDDWSQLRRDYQQRIRPHNKLQDDAIASIPSLQPTLFVRRRRTKTKEGSQQGLNAREDLADALPAALNAVEEDKGIPIHKFPDAPGFDLMSKFAFAEAAIQLGILESVDAATYLQD